MPEWSNWGIAGAVVFLVLTQGFQIVKMLINKTPVMPPVQDQPPVGTPTQIVCNKDNCPLVNIMKDICKKLDKLAPRIEDTQDKVITLDRLHNNFDNDGSPKWFLKESVIKNAESASKGVQDLRSEFSNYVDSQKDLTKGLSSHVETLNLLLKKIAGE